MTLDEILEEIKKAESIVLLTHETPDGDAIGSSLGMKLALRKIGKEADLIVTKYARTFNFLPNIEEIQTTSNVEKYDLAISLDCATIKRIDNREYFDKAKKTISIDHHGSNEMYADINYVNPVAPACSEIVLTMLSYFNIEIDKEIGTCLMMGIITDTGGLQYPSTTADTFEYAAELLRKGVDIADICRRTLQEKTKSNFELQKIIMENLELLEDGKLAFSYVTKQDLLDVKAEEGDHEGLVNIGRSIEGVEVSVFIREEETNLFKISMRSNGKINVSDICLMFGGGGHQRAAGAKVKGTVEQIKEKIIKEVEKYL